jgi:two-component system, chemotaxis family, protein-glutamate methylesterase/glutaminase
VSPNKKHVRVVIADDSLVAREMISQILSSDPSIEVVGQAKDGLEAVELVARLRPDLITMDIHMPKLDGLAAIEQIMAYTPTPILVVSSSVRGEGVGTAFDALSLGALEVIKKPEPKDWADLQRIGHDVIRKVKVLASVRVITHIRGRREHRDVDYTLSAGRSIRRGIIAIGSSTGGPSALLAVLGRLPKDLKVPVLVAQHIADGFIPGLVGWLNAGCAINIVAAEEGQRPQPGTVYFAHTGSNMIIDAGVLKFIAPGRGQLYIPSADTLFESVAKCFGERTVGVLLTGMGADGAHGMRQLHDLGAATIAQDESTSMVFGMPKAAIDLGAADDILPVNEIGAAIVAALG